MTKINQFIVRKKKEFFVFIPVIRNDLICLESNFLTAKFCDYILI